MVYASNRGQWFNQRGDIESFRQKIREACPITKTASTDLDYNKRKRKLVIYQRDKSRRISNEEEMLVRMRYQTIFKVHRSHYRIDC